MNFNTKKLLTLYNYQFINTLSINKFNYIYEDKIR